MKRMSYYIIGLLLSLMSWSCSDDAETGREEIPVETDGGYLFAHMTNANYGKLYYAVSRDGINWETLNKGRIINSAPENTNAEFPCLEINPRSLNNGLASTFWYRNGNYLRIKTAQIGYNFPKKWLSPLGVEALRLYVEGYNLLTFSAVSKYNIDPESPAVNNGYYPQQRTYTLGAKITF